MARNNSATDPDTNRRRLLQSLGVAGAAGLAGCSDLMGNGNGDGDTFDEELAQQLQEGFDEAGFETPWEGEIITNENPERVAWAQIVQEELNATEFFDLELNELEWGTYTGRVLVGGSHEDKALVCLGWSAGFAPNYYVAPLFGSDYFTPACCNINHYSSETVDELLQQGISTFDTEERASIYEDLQREVVQDSPMSFIRFGEAYNVWNTDRVHGFETFPNESYMFRSLYAPYAGLYTYVGEEGSPEEDGEFIGSIGSAPATPPDPTQMNDNITTSVTDPIYEKLLAVDADGQIHNELATGMNRVDDTTYEFTLREGVQFHPSDEYDFDGREMTAEDVKFSFERYLTTTREADVGDFLVVPETGEDEVPQEFEGSVEAVDDYTVRFSLPEIFADFQYSVAGIPIVPQEAGYPETHPDYDDGGVLDLTTEPIGTGAFTFGERQPDELWRVERFDDHWFEGNDSVPAEPPLQTVTFRIIVESSVQRGALEGGDIDLADSAPPKSISDFENNSAYTVQRRTSSSYDFIAYPMHEEADTPFQNQKVRRAVNRMINRQGIIEAVYDGIGQPAYAPISPLAAEFTSEEFQQEMADEYSRYYGASSE